MNLVVTYFVWMTDWDTQMFILRNIFISVYKDAGAGSPNYHSAGLLITWLIEQQAAWPDYQKSSTFVDNVGRVLNS